MYSVMTAFILLFIDTLAILLAQFISRKPRITNLKVKDLTREERFKYPWHTGCLIYNLTESLQAFYDHCITFNDEVDKLLRSRLFNLEYQDLVSEVSTLAVQVAKKSSKDLQEASDHLFRTSCMLKLFGYNRTVAKILDTESIYACKRTLDDTLKIIQDNKLKERIV